VADAFTCTRCVHEFTVADVHAHVIDRTAAEAEEHQVPGQQVCARDARARRELRRGRARDADACARMRERRETRAVEAGARIAATVTIGLAHFRAGEPGDEGAGADIAYGRGGCAGGEEQRQQQQRRE
jgi:hypothetical protein